MASRDERIKELLYDIGRIKGDFDAIEKMILNYNCPDDYKFLAEYSISDRDTLDDQDSFETELNNSVTQLEADGHEPTLIKISIYENK